MDRVLSCRLKVDLTFPTVVVDCLLVLHKPAQVLYVSLQEHLGFQKAIKILTKYLVTSAKGIVRLNRSQMSIILTYEVFGRAFDTLINLCGKECKISRLSLIFVQHFSHLHCCQHQHDGQVDSNDGFKEEGLEVHGNVAHGVQ